MNNRFKEVRLYLHLSQKDMAGKLGLSSTAVQKYEYGITPISELTLIKMKELFDVNINWLKTGNGDMFIQQNTDEQFINIPYYSEVSASAGSGILVYDENTINRINLSTKLLDINIDKNMCIINAAGDSMHPFIDDKDLLLIDLSCKTFYNEGVYVIKLEDTLLVKRVQKILNGIVLISYNPAYQPIELTAASFDNNNVAIIGKVVSIIKNLS